MKKLLILVIAVLILFTGCKIAQEEQTGENNDSIPQVSEPEETPLLEAFSFREHKFWDSQEQVIEKEGEPGRDIQHEEEYAYTIIYDDVEVFGYQAELSYTFLYKKLYSIRVTALDPSETLSIEQRYDSLKENLSKLYGEPLDETESYENGYELIAFWTDSQYGLTLFSDENGFWIVIRRVE